MPNQFTGKQKTTDRLLERLDLELHQYEDTISIFHAGAWEASCTDPASPLYRPPTPLFTTDPKSPLNADTQIEQFLLTQYTGTIPADPYPQGHHPSDQAKPIDLTDRKALYHHFRNQGHTPNEAKILSYRACTISPYTGKPKLTKAQAQAKAIRTLHPNADPDKPARKPRSPDYKAKRAARRERRQQRLAALIQSKRQ